MKTEWVSIAFHLYFLDIRFHWVQLLTHPEVKKKKITFLLIFFLFIGHNKAIK